MKSVIFGASKFGEFVYNKIRLKYDVVAFCDNNKMKIGTMFCDKPVISPNNLKEEQYYIIIASMYHIEIVRQLLDMKIFKFAVFSNLIENDDRVVDYNYSGHDFKEKNNKISIIDSGNSGSNSLALYRYLKCNENICVNLIKESDKEYYYEVFTSKIIIKSQDTTYIPGKINIQMWHGIPLKGLNYTSSSQGVDKEKNHKIWNDSYIISYSQMYNNLIGACYGIDENKFFITGMPRNDLLLESKGIDNLRIICPRVGDEKIIFYLPTFRASSMGEIDGDTSGYLFGFDNLNKLDMYLKENNILIICKMHPFEENKYIDFIKNNNIHNIIIIEEIMLEKHNFDLYEILNAADILITDYSSVFFDYLLLDKPIIFINKDIEQYKKLRGIMLEPYDFWTPGVKCNNIDDLLNDITEIQNNMLAYKEKRRIIKNIMHRYNDSNSRLRIENFIMKMINIGGED